MHLIKKIMRFFWRRVRGLAIKLVDGVVAVQKHGTPKSSRVLVIRLDAIGDYILWLNSARALRELYPEDGYSITLLANGAWASLAEYEGCFDEVWAVDRRRLLNNPLYRFMMLMKLRRGAFGIAIQPTYSREFLVGDSLVRASAAPERTGSEGDLTNITRHDKDISDRWYTRLIPAEKRQMMELERNAEFMRGLGLDEFKAQPPRLGVRSLAHE